MYNNYICIYFQATHSTFNSHTLKTVLSTVPAGRRVPAGSSSESSERCSGKAPAQRAPRGGGAGRGQELSRAGQWVTAGGPDSRGLISLCGAGVGRSPGQYSVPRSGSLLTGTEFPRGGRSTSGTPVDGREEVETMVRVPPPPCPPRSLSQLCLSSVSTETFVISEPFFYYSGIVPTYGVQ